MKTVTFVIRPFISYSCPFCSSMFSMYSDCIKHAKQCFESQDFLLKQNFKLKFKKGKVS